MENSTSPKRLPKPESLEAKLALMARLPYDTRVTRKHMLVFGFVLDWYHRKYGDALASVRHVADKLKERDPDGVGLHRGRVGEALADLTSWGYLKQDKGAGRRASRYVPAWDLVCVPAERDTTEAESCVPDSRDASVPDCRDATGHSVPDCRDEDSLTGSGYDPVTSKGEISSTPGGAPAPGLAAGPDAPGGGFDELWREYGHRRNKPDARAAYDQIAPGDNLHRTMVEAARGWRAAWEAQGKPDAPRKHLATWLREERYDEDPPRGFTPKQKKPTSKSKPASEPTPPASEAAAASEYAPKPSTADHEHNMPKGRHTMTIVAARVVVGDDDHLLALLLEDARSRPFNHEFAVASADYERQQDGQKKLNEITDALGIPPVDDAAELVGRVLLAVVDADRRIRYEPIAAANDNAAPADCEAA